MKPLLFGAIFLLIGIGALIGAMALWKHTNAFLATAKRVPGEVIELVAKRSSDSDTTYAPKFRFTTEDGTAHEVTSNTSSKPAAFDIGAQVSVLYQPERPDDAKIDSFSQLWLGPLILGIFATVFSLVGVGAIVFGRRAGGQVHDAAPMQRSRRSVRDDGRRRSKQEDDRPERDRDWDDAVDDQ